MRPQDVECVTEVAWTVLQNSTEHFQRIFLRKVLLNNSDNCFL